MGKVASEALQYDQLSSWLAGDENCPTTIMYTMQQRVTFRELPHSLIVMVAQRLPVHPRQLFKAANTSTGMLAAVEELVLEIQQALCAEYGVDRIQDIPAGVLPKLSEDGETEQVLRLIVARCPLDGVDIDGYTGLINASFEGHVDIVNALIGARAAVDTQDEHGETALINASSQGHVDIVNALIGARAAVDTQDERGRTGLILASRNGEVDIVNTLIGAHAAVGTQNENGETALSFASRFGYSEIAAALRAAGATK